MVIFLYEGRVVTNTSTSERQYCTTCTLKQSVAWLTIDYGS